MSIGYSAGLCNYDTKFLCLNLILVGPLIEGATNKPLNRVVC